MQSSRRWASSAPPRVTNYQINCTKEYYRLSSTCGAPRCQNLQGRAHLSQQAAESGRSSVQLDQHQDKLNYTPMTHRAVTGVLRSFPVVAQMVLL